MQIDLQMNAASVAEGYVVNVQVQVLITKVGLNIGLAQNVSQKIDLSLERCQRHHTMQNQ
jgi:hypothetical protein